MIHRSTLPITLLLAMLTTSACSEHSYPDNPEPTILISEATGITHTEATVKGTIERHGGSPLSYAKLHCCETSGSPDKERIVNADPSLSIIEFHLTGLQPGSSYSCDMEAGTATASLKSNTISFTTIPNELPKVSDIRLLSTGPLGIIVSFGIIDSGGEEIIAAGCEIKEAGNMKSRQIYATCIDPLPSEVRITINGLTPYTTYDITPFASNSLGESHGETLKYTTKESIILTEPGMLASLFISTDREEMESLTIAGPMNGDDFRTLRSMLGATIESGIRLRLSHIDLTDAQIVEGGSSYDGQRFTVADRLSTGLLAGCDRLHTAILPNSAIAMDRNAFAGCRSLELLTVPAGIQTLLPSSDCTALKAIEVSQANTHFKSDQGVLLNADASAILWFPLGKTGEYCFPSTVSSIGENAFAGTSISTLIIPSGVTSISRGAFAASALTEIKLPDNMTNISEGMFQNCSSLKTVRLGAATEFIGDFVFDGTDLTDLYVSADYPPYTTSEAFHNRLKPLADGCTLHIPEGTLQLYRNHAKWSIFKKIDEFQP